MWTLTTTDGTVITMRDGFPFLYTTRALADIGRRVLTKHLKRPLLIAERV